MCKQLPASNTKWSLQPPLLLLLPVSPSSAAGSFRSSCKELKRRPRPKLPLLLLLTLLTAQYATFLSQYLLGFIYLMLSTAPPCPDTSLMFGLFKQHKEKTNIELPRLRFTFLILFYLFPREKNPIRNFWIPARECSLVREQTSVV